MQNGLIPNGQRLGQYLGTGSDQNDDLIYRTYYCNTPMIGVHI